MSSIPLVRVLTDSGYGSRREVSDLVKKGMVEINGRPASSFTEQVNPDVDSVVVTGRKVTPGTARRVYLIMNKPEGYLSTTEDDRGRSTVMDLLPERWRKAGLHPAGRLDEDSTGLLVLTNDGQLTHELTHPRYEHEKEYYVATTGRLTDADLDKLEQGVEIEGQVTWPAKVRLLLGQSPFTYSITIHEGRKRQVRMMFAAIGQQVAILKRVRIGGLFMGDLKEGEWRELTPTELTDLMRKRPLPQRPSGATEKGGRQSDRAARPALRQSFRESTSVRSSRTSAPSTEPRSSRSSESGPVPHPSRRPADDRDTRPYVRRAPAPASGRRHQPVTDQRDSRPPPHRTATDRPRRLYRKPDDRTESRPYTRRPSGSPTERTSQRPPADRASRPYGPGEFGTARQGPYRRTTGEKAARPYVPREGYPPSRPPHRRPSADRDTRPYDRRELPPTGSGQKRRPGDVTHSQPPARLNARSAAEGLRSRPHQKRVETHEGYQRRRFERTQGPRHDSTSRSRSDERFPQDGRPPSRRPQQGTRSEPRRDTPRSDGSGRSSRKR